jgi:Gas vesicle synthesis protein GvpL/GvpF
VGGLNTLHLVHGVMRAGTAGLPPLAAAVEGGTLTLVEAGPLAALTTVLPRTLRCGTPASDLFGDVERTRAAALEHHRVLSGIAASHDVAPVRLGALRAGDASVIDMLREDAERLADVLAEVSGMVEVVVRIVSSALDAAPAPVAAPATGRDYLRARSASAQAGRHHEARAQAFADIVRERLALHASRVKAGPLVSTPGQPRRWLDLAMLVPRDAVPAVEAETSALVAEAGVLRLAVTLAGPWPAYSFVAKEE